MVYDGLWCVVRGLGGSDDTAARGYWSPHTNTFSVNPTSGTVSAASLTASVWYDHRGNVIKSIAPGGLVNKNQYDGVGMRIATYQTDGQGDATWADAGSVASNQVLSQTETQ